MGRLLKLAWAQIALALLAGIMLTLLPVHGWTEPLHHIGIGLLVAAVVTSFWHLREFSEFFEKFSRSILVDDHYLSKLSFKSLADLRLKAARAILQSCVDNPNYKHDELGNWIDQVLFEDLLPGRAPLSGIYRKNFKEDVCLEFLTLKDALEELGLHEPRLPESALAEKILKVTSMSRFTVIAPRLNSKEYAHYEVLFGGRASVLPHFPLEHRVKLAVGHSEKDAQIVRIAAENEPKGGITFKADKITLPFDSGQCVVWMNSVEYQSPERQQHILNTMSMLTYGLEVDLRQVGHGPQLVFEGDMVATGSADKKDYLPRGIELIYNGWLFEGHGYYLWWWEN